MTREALTDAMQALRELAGTYDYDSVCMVVDELARFRVPDEYGALYDNLTKAVREINWDAIHEITDSFFKGGA